MLMLTYGADYAIYFMEMQQSFLLSSDVIVQKPSNPLWPTKF